MKSLILVATLIFSFSSFAGLDVSVYELNEKQIETIRRLEKRGLPEKTIKDYAEAIQRHNRGIKGASIPPHTQEDLEAVTAWAEGAAFRIHAAHAGYSFDYKAYMADCPNIAIFNFGRANGTKYINHDVLYRFANTVFYLDMVYARDPQGFKEAFAETVKGTPFEKYLIANSFLELVSY